MPRKPQIEYARYRVPDRNAFIVAGECNTLDEARRLAQTSPERLDVFFVPSLKLGMQADGILIYSDGHESPMKVAEFMEGTSLAWAPGSADSLFRKLRKNKIWGGF